MTISSLVNAFQQLFGDRKKRNFISHKTRSKGVCPECGWIVLENKKNKRIQVQASPGENKKIEVQGREINDDLKFSYSKISLFEKCPKAYHFKYVLKKDELFLTIEQHLGKAIHSALDKSYMVKDHDGKIPFDYVKVYFDQAWNDQGKESIKVIKKKMKINDYYLYGQQMLQEYYHRVLSSDNSKTVALEKYFEIKVDSSICYRGYIDRISINLDGMMRITDYKTGKWVNNPLEDMQLPSYSLWCFEEFKRNEIEVVFEALQHGKTLTEKINKSQIQGIKNKLMRDINNVRSATEFKATPSILCSWCGYNSICSHDNSDECPTCGGELEEREGRYGTFIGCSEYPCCRYTRNDW